MSEPLINELAEPVKKSILSSREREMVYHLMGGLNTFQVATLLEIKPSIVSRMKGKIFRKLRVETIIQLKDVMDWLTQLKK